MSKRSRDVRGDIVAATWGFIAGFFLDLFFFTTGGPGGGLATGFTQELSPIESGIAFGVGATGLKQFVDSNGRIAYALFPSLRRRQLEGLYNHLTEFLDKQDPVLADEILIEIHARHSLWRARLISATDFESDLRDALSRYGRRDQVALPNSKGDDKGLPP